MYVSVVMDSYVTWIHRNYYDYYISYMLLVVFKASSTEEVKGLKFGERRYLGDLLNLEKVHVGMGFEDF